MRHALPPRSFPPRAIPRHALRIHRPRPQVRGRVGAQPPVRASDLVLALIGVAFLGALGLMAAASLIGRAVAP